MTRLLVHVEGETEEGFVNNVLAPHLYDRGFTGVSARLLGNVRQRSHRGGVRAWNAVRRDIVNHLREDPACIATTMVDYYGMPKDGSRAWPGRSQAAGRPFREKAATVQNALSEEVSQEMGSSFNQERFIPYVVMHEFEALLFSDCEGFSQGIGQPDLAQSFQAIRDEFDSPEEIDDSPVTAPSKRIEELVPGYPKPLFGNLAAMEIGIVAMRNACPHFRNWLNRLETFSR